MQRMAIPAGMIAAARLSVQIRKALDWAKMKDKLGDVLASYQNIVKMDRETNPNSKLKPLAVSMENTAKQILWVFLKKYEKGQIKKNCLKFTYSYLANSLGKNFRNLSISTVTRHIQRFMEMPNSFIRLKQRATLGIPNLDVNCVMIELDPRLIIFKDPRQQAIQEQATEAIMSPVVKPKSTKPINLNPQPMTAPASHTKASEPQSSTNRREAPKGLGDIMGQMFGGLFQTPDDF